MRLLKKVKPSVTKIYSYSWDRMTDLNAWWETELRKAFADEGFELAEFALMKSHQAELAYADSLLDPNKAVGVYAEYLQKRFRNPFIAYEDSLVRIGALMGACVVWKDLGAQMADLGARVLSGEDPGSIPWEYPRKFSIIINKMTADRLGIVIPREIIDAAYRIYTDYQGSFMGNAIPVRPAISSSPPRISGRWRCRSP